MSGENFTRKEKESWFEIKIFEKKNVRMPNPIYFKRPRKKKKHKKWHQYTEVCGKKMVYQDFKSFVLKKNWMRIYLFIYLF